MNKSEPKELSLPARTRQKRKLPSRETKQEIDQQPTGFAEGLDQLQQEAGWISEWILGFTTGTPMYIYPPVL